MNRTPVHVLLAFFAVALPVAGCTVTSASGGDGTAAPGSDGGGGGGGTSNDGGVATDGSTARSTKVVAMGRATCVVHPDGRLHCFGGNDAGQLGLGDTDDRGASAGTMTNLPVVDLGPGAVVVDVAGGSNHACALLVTGKVKCWGSNNQGQLGLGDANDRGKVPGQMGANLPEVVLGAGRTARQLAAGDQFTCALLDDGKVKCWGRNSNGQLGLERNDVNLGRAPSDMTNLGAIDLGPGRTALEIGAGEQHACARLDDETIKCWGGNGDGQLGLGDTTPRGRKVGEMGANLQAVSFGQGRKAKGLYVAAGGLHNCAKLDDGTVKCWGRGSGGALGNGSLSDLGGTPQTLGDGMPTVALPAGQTATSLHLGTGFTCARLGDGRVTCWGDNANGVLGRGNITDVGDGPGEMGDALVAIPFGAGRTVQSLSAGFTHACIVGSDDKVRCWGGNVSGQLGVGDRNARGGAPNQMGDALVAVELP